jgi:broad specificity phosphatase PhoE
MGSAARPAIISHLASRLKPAKAARSAGSPEHDHVFSSPKTRTRVRTATFLRELLLTLALLQHSPRD